MFKKGLNPKKSDDNTLNFYGINIDTNEISKNVKTVAELQNEQKEINEKINGIKQSIQKLQTDLNDDLDKLKRRFHPKIKELKENILQNEYNLQTGKSKLDELAVQLTEWESKAKSEQQSVIKNIEEIIAQLNEEKIKSEEEVLKIETSISKTIDAKKKEKSSKIKEEQKILVDISQNLDAQIQEEKKNIHKKFESIKTAQKNELKAKGADTIRVDAIDLRLSELQSELIFIENNRDKVAEYNKDKRELFDKVFLKNNAVIGHDRFIIIKRGVDGSRGQRIKLHRWHARFNRERAHRLIRILRLANKHHGL